MDNGNKAGDVMVCKPLMIDPKFVWLYNPPLLMLVYGGYHTKIY